MIENLYNELDKYAKRLSRKQKNNFLKFLQEKLVAFKYKTKITEGRYFFKCKNLETEASEPEIILGAHYDTPTILPFFLEYIFRIFGHTRQFFLIVGILILMTLIMASVKFFPEIDWLMKALKYTIYLSFLSMLIPNPKNKNDNTSGVAALLILADRFSNDENLKNKVKFIFFDNEELGLLGSMMQKNHMRNAGIDLRKLKFISLDCVGRGEKPVLVYTNKHNSIIPELEMFFSEDTPAKSIRLPFYPLSDNYAFSISEGVNISWMDKTWIPGGYYIRNIHCPRDNEVDYPKIIATCDVVEKFIRAKISQ
jgi:hypothetical protein